MKPLKTSVNVVLIGSFQASQFFIESLQRVEALSAQELASARYQLLIPDQAVQINIPPWGKLTVVLEQLTVEATEAPFIRAADLALKCLREAAPTSQVRMMGINVVSVIGFTDYSERDALGARLVPAANWGKWGKSVHDSLAFPLGDPKHGGLTTVTLRQGLPEDRDAGYIDVRVDGLIRIEGDSLTAVQISVNDHYEMSARSLAHANMSAHVQTATMLEILERSFDTSVARSIGIIDSVLGGE